jgi:hypothetical protein
MFYRGKDIYYGVKSWFKYNLFNKNWHKIRKSVNQAKPWDYAYWQETLYHYLEYQAAYFEKAQFFVGWERAVKEIRLCKSLLEIVMEKRDISDFSSLKPTMKIYVNTRNAKRFISYEGADMTRAMWQVELYERKANRLLYRILEERSRTWWD